MKRLDEISAHVPRQMVGILVDSLSGTEIWRNDRYTASVRRSTNEYGKENIWISISNRDQSSRHDWRDFQYIKNDILGPEQEAIEIYPAESRLVDLSNQFHLWSIKDFKFDFVGFRERMVSQDGDDCGAVQRRWPDSDVPKDLKYMTHEEMKKAAKEMRKE